LHHGSYYCNNFGHVLTGGGDFSSAHVGETKAFLKETTMFYTAIVASIVVMLFINSIAIIDDWGSAAVFSIEFGFLGSVFLFAIFHGITFKEKIIPTVQESFFAIWSTVALYMLYVWVGYESIWFILGALFLGVFMIRILMSKSSLIQSYDMYVFYTIIVFTVGVLYLRNTWRFSGEYELSLFMMLQYFIWGMLFYYAMVVFSQIFQLFPYRDEKMTQTAKKRIKEHVSFLSRKISNEQVHPWYLVGVMVGTFILLHVSHGYELIPQGFVVSSLLAISLYDFGTRKSGKR
jgi:hypothetical protein